MKFLLKFSPFFFLATVTSVIFYKILFLGQVFYEGFDDINLFIPGKYYLIEQLRLGIFPLWNPYIFIGTPYFADISHGVLSVFTIILVIFGSPAQSIAIMTALIVFLFGAFQYLFLRNLKVSRFASVFGALVFAFSGVPFNYIRGFYGVSVIVFIPLLFLCAHLLIKKRELFFLFILIFLQCLQILSGHPRVTYYTIFFISLFLFFWSNFSRKKKIGIVLSYWISCICLCAIQIIPFAEYTILSNRPLSSFAFASSGGLSLPHIITTFFPTFFGTHIDGTWWGPQVMLFGYMSVPAYLLLWFGLRHGKVVKKSFYVFAMVLSLALSFGKFSPIYILFYYFLPTWSLFRNPIDLITLFVFFASILTATGWDFIIEKTNKINSIGKKALPFFTALFLPLSILYFVLANNQNFWRKILQVFQHIPFAHVNRLLIYDDVKLHTMFQGILANISLLFLFIAITFAIFLFFSKQKKLLQVSLLIFTAITFIYFDSKLLTTASPLFLNKGDDVPPILHEAQNGNYRILSLPIDSHQHREHLAPSDFFYKETSEEVKTYAYNLNIPHHLYQVNAVEILIPASFADYIEGKGTQIVDAIPFSKVSKDQLDQISTKYIISNEPLRNVPSFLTLQVVKQKGIYIYENSTARKRVYLEDLPLGNAVKFLENSPEKIIMQVEASKSGNLILTNWYYPGWVAYVNGKKETIQKYKETFQMVLVPSGNSLIVFEYKPLSFVIGLWISIVSSLILFVSFLLFQKKTFK